MDKVVIRRAKVEDAQECGRICYEAFRAIAEEHRFPPDLPSPEAAIGVLAHMFAKPGIYGVVAEREGKILGSNCLDERMQVAGVGPVTVDPQGQNQQVGRKLMEAVLDRVAERKFPGVRLIQAGYHTRSLSLYAKLGFVVREPVACMQGRAIGKVPREYKVRPVETKDVEACNTLCSHVHGHHRVGELQDGIASGAAILAEREGQLEAYASTVGFFGHAVARSNEAMQALLGAAESFRGPGILVPTRNAELFLWCLTNGLRVAQPMTLMTKGLYSEPAGSFLPSINF